MAELVIEDATLTWVRSPNFDPRRTSSRVGSGDVAVAICDTGLGMREGSVARSNMTTTPTANA